jgi:hypothetical protein
VDLDRIKQMILDSMPPELRAACTVGVVECSADDIPPELVAAVERVRDRQKARALTRQDLEDMRTGKIPLDREAVVRVTNENAETLGLNIRAAIGEDGRLYMTDTEGNAIDPRAAHAWLVGSRERILMDAKMARAHTVEIKGDQVCVCRYEIRLRGAPFAGCYDPRVVLREDALPEGDYEVFWFCTCGDPENSGMFGVLRFYGDGIGVLKGLGGSVWTRDG